MTSKSNQSKVNPISLLMVYQGKIKNLPMTINNQKQVLKEILEK